MATSNAASAKGEAAVDRRTWSQSTCSRIARIIGRTRARSQ
ncbi:hypothetical protein [Frankia sp. ArI3]|nr:hypothetical protein [Frankia sp. ArI3]